MPSMKCGGCAKFLSSLEAARCSICKVLYHRVCGDLSPKSRISTTWVCPECKTRSSRSKEAQAEEPSSEEFLDTSALSDTNATEGIEMPLILKSFKDELQQDFRNIIKEELSAMRQDFQNQFQRLRDDLAMLQTDRDNLRESVKSCNIRIDGMDVRLKALEQKLAGMSTEGESAGVAQLRAELNDRDQKLLANDIEVSNLPECSGENLIHTVLLIANNLRVQIEERDIVSADRVGSRRVNATDPAGVMDSRPRPVVVRLARRGLRDEFIHSARVRRGVSTVNLGIAGPAKRFYINERLTKVYRLLFRRARDVGQRLGWKFVWTRHGRILARNKPGDPAYNISNEEDLLRVFGPDVNKTPKA